MSSESTPTAADRIGPNAKSDLTHNAPGYLGQVSHNRLTSQRLYDVQYHQRASAHDELHISDEESDESSQSSSDDGLSQSSDTTARTSPLHEDTDESYSVSDHPTLAEGSVYQKTGRCKYSTTAQAHAVPRHLETNATNRPHVSAKTVDPDAFQQAYSVPYRPKATACPPPALQIDTSRVADDVQRSRMRPPEELTQGAFAARRRGRSVCSQTPPPRLKRDTEQSDNVVRMIVLFCTHLIQSIWSPGAQEQPAQSGQHVLPLQVFITETLRRSKTSYSTLQIALYYLILLKQCFSQCASTGQPVQGCRAMQCGRRMFLTALILASKYLQDRNYSARAWSKISGLPLKEINDNERRYLSIVHWDLHVPKDTFENWNKIVLSVCRLSKDQESCRDALNTQSPPGPGSSGQGCFIQKACQETVAAFRNWWLSSLRALCTDIVKCPQKTDKFVCSISPFRESAILPRPIIEKSWQDELADSRFRDQTSSTNALPRLPSIKTIAKAFATSERDQSPVGLTKLPPPRMLANLPTPLQTPHGTDMSGMWTPRDTRLLLRCRASASALGNVDQRRCPMATLSNCPPPKPKPQVRPSWIEQEPNTMRQVPDRSLNSSPESVASETPSVFTFSARSRSSSISSTSSWITSSSSKWTISDKQHFEDGLLHSSETQHSLQHQDGRGSVSHNTGLPPTPPKEPDTLRIEQLNKLFSSHSQLQTFQKPAALTEPIGGALHENFQEAELGPLPSSTLLDSGRERSNESTPRPRLTRHQSHRYEPITTTNDRVLKRSRSESLDLSQDKVLAPSAGDSYWTKHQHSQAIYSIMSGLRAKEMVPSARSYLSSRLPVQSYDMCKRMAVQPCVAAGELDKEKALRNLHLQGINLEVHG